MTRKRRGGGGEVTGELMLQTLERRASEVHGKREEFEEQEVMDGHGSTLRNGKSSGIVSFSILFSDSVRH